MYINTDSLQTYLGLLEAILISASGVIYAAIESPEGFQWKSPVMWGAVVMAVIRTIKSYFAAGVHDPATGTTAVVGLNAPVVVK